MSQPLAGAPRRGAKSASAFRTISEVAAELDVPQHVLRFWETKFSQIRPLKRGGGRRYYRPEDVRLLRSIRKFLYDDGYTIRGVQKLLKSGALRLEGGPDGEGETLSLFDSPQPAEAAAPPPRAAAPARVRAEMTADQRAELREMLRELRSLRDLLMQVTRG